MIQIKTYFNDWKVVDRQTAIRCINNLLNGMTNIPAGTKNSYINQNKLKGTTVEKLLMEA